MFNNIFFKHLLNLSRPPGAADRSTLPVAGDSAAGKRAVTGFLESIGYDALDYGPLAESWRQEPGQPVYGTPYGRSTTRRAGPPAPTSSGRASRFPVTLVRLLCSAGRYSPGITRCDKGRGRGGR